MENHSVSEITTCYCNMHTLSLNSSVMFTMQSSKSSIAFTGSVCKIMDYTNHSVPKPSFTSMSYSVHLHDT